MTRAAVLGAAVTLFALILTAAPAGAARPRLYAFVVTSADMSEVVTFQGDGGPACTRAGVCGYSGRMTYGFGSGNGLAGFALHSHHAVGTADFFFSGLTSVTVQGPDGGPPCTEKILQDFDGFEVKGTASRLRLLFHTAFDAPDFLESYCVGPRDLDIERAHALPELIVPVRLLRRRHLLLHVASQLPFHAGPFVGSVSFTAHIRMRRAIHTAAVLDFLGVR